MVEENNSPCPGGQYCDCCRNKKYGEVRKLVEIKKGLTLYHAERKVDDEMGGVPNFGDLSTAVLVKDAGPTDLRTVQTNNMIVIIVHNTGDHDITSEHLRPEIDIDTVNCPRCRHIMTRAKVLLEGLPVVKKESIGCACELCTLQQRSRVPCQFCRNVIKQCLITSIKDDKIKEHFMTFLANAARLLSLDTKTETAKKEEYLTKKRIKEEKKVSIETPKRSLSIEKYFADRSDSKIYTEPHKLTDQRTDHVKQSLRDSKYVPCKSFSDNVLGIGTTGLKQQSYSELSLSYAIEKEITKEPMKFFFPSKTKKEKVQPYKTSFELFEDTSKRLKSEADEKLKTKDDIKLQDKLEKYITGETDKKRMMKLSKSDEKYGYVKDRTTDVKEYKIKETKSDVKHEYASDDKKYEKKSKETGTKEFKKYELEKENVIKFPQKKVTGEFIDKVSVETKKESEPKIDKGKHATEIKKSEDVSEKLKSGVDEISKMKKGVIEDVSKKPKASEEDASKTKKGGEDDVSKKIKARVEDASKVKKEGEGDISKKTKARVEETSKTKKGGEGDISKKPKAILEETSKMKKRGDYDVSRKTKLHVDEDSKIKKGVEKDTSKKMKASVEDASKLKKEGEQAVGKKIPADVKEISRMKKAGEEGVSRKTKEGVEESRKMRKRGEEDAIKRFQAGVQDDSKLKKENLEMKREKESKGRITKEPIKEKKSPKISGTKIKEEKKSKQVDKGTSMVETKDEKTRLVKRDRTIPEGWKKKIELKKMTSKQESTSSKTLISSRDLPSSKEKSAKSAKPPKPPKPPLPPKAPLSDEPRKTGVKNEINLLNAVLDKQEKLKEERLKHQQKQEEALGKFKDQADKREKDILGRKSLSYINLKHIKHHKKKHTKEEGKVEIKTSKKEVEVQFKDVRPKFSGDDLILKLIQKYQRKVNLKDLKNRISPARGRTIISSSRYRREPRHEGSSEPSDQLPEKTVSEAELVYGNLIITKQELPPPPKPLQPTILFETALKKEVEETLSIEQVPTIDETPPTKKQKRKEEPPVEPPEPERKGVFRYVLSNPLYINNGWTVLPVEKIIRRMNVYRMRPAQPEFDWFVRNKGKGPMLYESGEKLAEVTEEGRGKWYYKNGRLALDYYDAEDLNTDQRFVIYSSGDVDERGRYCPVTVLGMFDHKGSGVVFDHSGKIRLKYNQTEGVVLDRGIGPVCHWTWHSLNEPPELQQVMVDTRLPYIDPRIYALTEDENRLVERQEDETMTAIEFDNYVKSKQVKHTQVFKPHQINMKAMKINEQFSLKVLDQKSVYLIFREGGTTMRLNLGMVLDHTEIVDTASGEVGQVSLDVDEHPPKTDSVTELQKILMNARKVNRVRAEKESKKPETISKPLETPLLTTNVISDYSKCGIPVPNNLYINTRLI